MSDAALLARQRSQVYTCAHLAAEVWQRETGQDIRAMLGVFGGGVTLHGHRALQRIEDPVSPCIALFQRAKVEVHVGVFVRGRVLHLSEAGPIRQPLSVAAIGYTSVRFYAPRPTDN